MSGLDMRSGFNRSGHDWCMGVGLELAVEAEADC